MSLERKKRLIQQAEREEIAAVWRRFVADPRNDAAIKWLAKLQGLNTPAHTQGAQFQIWMDNGARALIAEIFGMASSTPPQDKGE